MHTMNDTFNYKDINAVRALSCTYRILFNISAVPERTVLQTIAEKRDFV